MKKKVLSVLLSVAMVASLLVGCGDNTEAPVAEQPSTTEEPTTTEEPVAPVEDTNEVTDAATLEAPSTDGWDASKEIYVYSWNSELGERLAYVIGSTDADGNRIAKEGMDVAGKYPEYAQYVHYVNLGVAGTDGTYQTAVDNALAAGDKYPSVIAADVDIVKYYTESDVTADLASVGITNEMYANAYKSTVQMGTYNGQLKALTWQATPGSFFYRGDIAEEVFGTSDPDEIQNLLKDWDAFFAAADQLKEAGYTIVPGPAEPQHAVLNAHAEPWIKVAGDGSESLNLDSTIDNYIEISNKLSTGGYTGNIDPWTDGWYAAVSGDNFGFFGCPWFTDAVVTGNAGDTAGDWRVCVGPQAYFWGGSYAMVMADTPNPELAAFLVYELCADPEVMYNIAADTGDFVNNKEAVANLIADGKGALDLLGGQNPVEAWADAATTLDLSNSSYLDAAIKSYVVDGTNAYNAGTIDSADGVIKYVKDQVSTNYDYVTVE